MPSANPPYALDKLCRQYGSPHRLRQRDRAEERLRIEVVLTRFVDNPQHVVLLRRGIAKRDVDFALLKRNRMPIIVHADDQFFCSCLCHGFKADV